MPEPGQPEMAQVLADPRLKTPDPPEEESRTARRMMRQACLSPWRRRQKVEWLMSQSAEGWVRRESGLVARPLRQHRSQDSILAYKMMPDCGAHMGYDQAQQCPRQPDVVVGQGVGQL